MEDEIFESVENEITGEEGSNSSIDTAYFDSGTSDGGTEIVKESNVPVNDSSDDIEAITLEDLELGKNVAVGAVVCGTGLLICLGVIGLLKILRQA